MKKTVFSLALAFVCIAIVSCITVKIAERYRSGVYSGEAQGYNGKIAVEVETDSASILDIKITKQNEDANIGGEALEELRRTILREDSTDVDAISGATATSDGFIKAVNQALKKARL